MRYIFDGRDQIDTGNPDRLGGEEATAKRTGTTGSTKSTISKNRNHFMHRYRSIEKNNRASATK